MSIHSTEKPAEVSCQCDDHYGHSFDRQAVSRQDCLLFPPGLREHREIARILGRSVGDSKSQLHKARTRLRELLHELQREKERDERLAAAKLRPDPARLWSL